jgi:hypothetical protein
MGEINEPTELSAVTPATVAEGLGYPNHRDEHSVTPIGWHGLDTENFENVSRETLPSNEAQQ